MFPRLGTLLEIAEISFLRNSGQEFRKRLGQVSEQTAIRASINRLFIRAALIYLYQLAAQFESRHELPVSFIDSLSY
jgi:hypothetical protein